MPDVPGSPGRSEKDRSTEKTILEEADRGPTLPESEKPRSGPDSARDLGTGAEGDLTRPGNQTEDR